MGNNLLSECRERKGISKKEMAEMLGIPVSNYWFYETGGRPIPKKIKDEIVKKLDIKEEGEIFLPNNFTISK